MADVNYFSIDTCATVVSDIRETRAKWVFGLISKHLRIGFDLKFTFQYQFWVEIHDLDSFIRFGSRLLDREWARLMLETVSVGDNFEMLVTDFLNCKVINMKKTVTNIMIMANIFKIVAILKSPTQICR